MKLALSVSIPARVLSGDRVGLDLRNILPDTDEDGVWDGDDLCPGTDLNVSVDSTDAHKIS